MLPCDVVSRDTVGWGVVERSAAQRGTQHILILDGASAIEQASMTELKLQALQYILFSFLYLRFSPFLASAGI